MKRITNINQLNPGEQIVRVDENCNLEVLEFICIHPHNENYSLFMNINYDGIPKFYNKRLETEVWYDYAKTSHLERLKLRLKAHEHKVDMIKASIKLYK